MATRTGASWDKPIGGNGESRVESAAVAIADLEASSRERLENLATVHGLVLSVIRKISDRRYRVILELYYLHGMTWEKIGDRMGYDQRWVQTLHGRALDAARAVIAACYPDIAGEIEDCSGSGQTDG